MKKINNLLNYDSSRSKIIKINQKYFMFFCYLNKLNIYSKIITLYKYGIKKYLNSFRFNAISNLIFYNKLNYIFKKSF